MNEKKSIALIIPIYNESRNIYKVIDTLPDIIDYVIVVNDGSTDDSKEQVILCLRDNRVGNHLIKELDIEIDNIGACKRHLKIHEFFLLNHSENLGKGAAIKTGYKFALALGAECIATIDGDGQMSPEELTMICSPILSNQADYAKGNRLAHPNATSIIPIQRLYGIYILTFFTRLCSGYYHLNDAQTGFTAIQADALRKIDIDKLFDYYGYVNDVLIRLSVHHLKVVEVPITPIYHELRDSKMNIPLAIPKISFLLLRLAFWKVTYQMRKSINNL